MREILRYRTSLVSMRTAIKNKVHAIHSKNGIDIEFSDIFSKKAIRISKGFDPARLL